MPLSPLHQALRVIGEWLRLPEDHYKAQVYLFAQRLPPENVLEAVWIAQAKLPDGGASGFKYFCGVCHNMIREQRIRQSWN